MLTGVCLSGNLAEVMSTAKSQVLTLVASAWDGFGAAFGPGLVMLSRYWDRMARSPACLRGV